MWEVRTCDMRPPRLPCRVMLLISSSRSRFSLITYKEITYGINSRDLLKEFTASEVLLDHVRVKRLLIYLRDQQQGFLKECTAGIRMYRSRADER